MDDLLGRNNKSRIARRDSAEWDLLDEISPLPKTSVISPSTTNYGQKTSSASMSSSSSAADNGQAQKKFGNAKAISSEQFFQDSAALDVTINNYQ